MEITRINSLDQLPTELPAGVYLCDVVFTADTDCAYTGHVNVQVPDGSSLDERWTVNSVGPGEGVPAKALIDTRETHFTHAWHENLWGVVNRLVVTAWFTSDGHALSVEAPTRYQFRKKED